MIEFAAVPSRLRSYCRAANSGRYRLKARIPEEHSKIPVRFQDCGHAVVFLSYFVNYIVLYIMKALERGARSWDRAEGLSAARRLSAFRPRKIFRTRMN